VSASRRTVTSSINFGGASSNHVATPGDDVNHLSGEVSIEVSGASTDYPHPTRLQREIEAAVSDVLDDYAERVSDDVDRGDGVETDGGVTTYECDECGEVKKCNVDDAGQRRCPDCGRAVTTVVTDGGRGLYTCDTPTCDGEKEVTTPDGYVCRDCADELALQYEEVDRGDEIVTDGGELHGRYHVVCPDCTFEALTRHRHRAARAVDAHRNVEPSHDARFEEVSGR